MSAQIASEFPFEAKHVVAGGVRLHYVAVGARDPVLFVHGNPTWSYLWRNVLPAVGRRHRAIALDLPGFGRSEQPVAGRYDFEDHARALAGFIDALGLERLSIVGHDWGGVLTMDWATRNVERVKSVALMSTSVVRVGGLLQPLLKLPRLPGLGWLLVQQLNLFLPLALRAGVRTRRLTAAELRHYREPFPDAASRLPIRRWTEQLPAGPGDAAYDAMARIEAALPGFDRPVLIVRGSRDPILTAKRAQRMVDVLPSARVEVMQGAGHFLQEDDPAEVGRLLNNFL